MTNAYLVRYIVPVIIKGIQPAPRGQGQSCQVVTGPAGVEQDHGTPYGSCLTHTGPLAEMTIEDLQGEKAPIFLYILRTPSMKPQGSYIRVGGPTLASK